MRVGDICNHHAAIIGKSDSVHTAAKLMRDQHVTYVVVVESKNGNNIPVGSLTDRDIVVKLAASNVDLDTVTAEEVMNAPPILAEARDSVMVTLKRMRYKVIQHIPVVDTNKALIGVLSIDDILESLTEHLNDIGHIITQKQLSVLENIFEKH
jgi:CBS domain-containing protein